MRWSYSIIAVAVSLSLGKQPRENDLEEVPTFTEGSSKEIGRMEREGEKAQNAASTVAQQTSTLLSLLVAQDSLGETQKATRVWLGEGLGSVPKRIHTRMVKWEYVAMQDLRPRSATDQSRLDGDAEKLVVLPGFEVTQPRKRPINNIITWVQCFARYTAAMAQYTPECTAGFMSHLLTVLKAFHDAEHPAWREYDEAFREKMASTGKKNWACRDVTLYQEVVGARAKLRNPQVNERRKEYKRKRPGTHSLLIVLACVLQTSNLIGLKVCVCVTWSTYSGCVFNDSIGSIY